MPYIPQVKNDVIPKINQEFVSLEAVHKFYNNYGKESGFGTREWSSRKNRDKVVVRKEYVCCKQGHWVPKKSVLNIGSSKRRRGIIREGCGAKLAVVRSKSGDKYVVSQFVEARNHPLTSPGRTHLLRSHRKVTAAKRALAEQLSQTNVPTCQQMSVFEVQAGGLENVGFGVQDLYNTERDIRSALLGQDADMLFEYFEIQQQKNSGFMYTMEKDNEMRQTTLFGCGLLSDESNESFEWLFKEWLKAMPGGPPKMTITDQDPAMTKAFDKVLPIAHHRYCIWHIVSKFSEKISALSYKDHYDEFKQCIWNSESPEEFEAKWADVVQKANLSSNEWLKDMYEIRERWIPAYMKHMFSAHMTSSQRAEISHSFFKKYVSLNNSLYDFVTRFARGLAHIRHNELDLDHKNLNEKPQLSSSFPMESTMSELYTLAIFHKFQDEHYQIGECMVKMTHEDEHNRFYTVERAKVSGARVRNLLVNKSSEMRNKLFKLASSVIDDAVLTEDRSELLEDALSSVRDKLCAMNLGREGGNLSASPGRMVKYERMELIVI
ncbi:hypothetical protein RHSIM_Rhsim06G0088300 [Rhododendron simsii]|uniref:Protein FAR1-RELATED SEQUENCE n=1 Tax=Rhododendron simsii TaxID=118357 RepID=A0A834GW31_RHOSS|nr:hypothetical protein RHSIM_Rhsim06G0088300 [Rhododendron simsii]